MSVGEEELAPQGVMSFPSIVDITSGTFTFSHGITPSLATISMVAQEANTVSTLPGEFTISYGEDVEITIPDCRVRSSSFQKDGAGRIIQCSIEDRRWRWQFPTISGVWNQWKDNTDLGVTVDSSTTAELMPGSMKTPQQLLTMCFEAMGENMDHVDLSKVPNNALIDVEWDMTNAAAAAMHIADVMGCRIIYHPLTNHVSVEPAGDGLSVPQTLDMTDYTQPIDFPDPPANIVCACSRIHYNLDFTLEAIGLDNDGVIRTLKNLKYAPNPNDDDGVGGFSKSDWRTGFYSITDPIVRARAAMCVFKWYRISGIKGFDTIADFPLEFNRLDYLPLMDTQVFSFLEETPEGNFSRPKPAWIYGVFQYYDLNNATHDNTVTGDNLHFIDYNAANDPATDPTDDYLKHAMFHKGFTIQGDKGIVKFDMPMINPQNTQDGTGEVTMPATLILRTSCYFRDPDTRQYVRHVFDLLDPPDDVAKELGIQTQQGDTNTSDDEKPLVLMHDELVLKRWPNYQEDWTVAHHGGMLDNHLEIDTYAANYIAAEAANYVQHVSEVGKYAGIKPFDMDGAIQVVGWEVGMSGAFTHIHANNERHPHVFTYKELLFYNQCRNANRQTLKTTSELNRDSMLSPIKTGLQFVGNSGQNPENFLPPV